jgi:LysR substrate binding domain
MRSWEADQPDTALVIKRVDDPELALRTGKIDVAFFRSTPGASTLHHTLLGHERRLAAVAVDDPLATRDALTVGTLAARRIALCATAASADLRLWPPDQQPDRTVVVSNVDEWLATIAAGDTAGLTSDSTEYDHPHPGVCYLPVSGVEPVPVFLSWPANNSHPMITTFVNHATQLLRTDTPTARPHRLTTNRPGRGVASALNLPASNAARGKRDSAPQR